MSHINLCYSSREQQFDFISHKLTSIGDFADHVSMEVEIDHSNAEILTYLMSLLRDNL